MPFTVQQLIQGRSKPVSVSQDSRVEAALERMVEHDYSQLPVVDATGKPLGLVTSNSILRALSSFGVSTSTLRVLDAMIKADYFTASEDLFDLLDDLRDSEAVLIIDGDEQLVGIVTSYDANEYFRRRAEDIMLVEDIESALKEHIRAAYTSANNDIDQSALSSTIEEITDSKRATKKRFEQALRQYLKNHDSSAGVKQQWLDDAFDKHFGSKDPVKGFDELTLNDYIELLLHKGRWAQYESVFALDPKAIRQLLDSVRQTRNALAHFRNEISPVQRQKLRYCVDWLARHQPVVPALTVTAITNVEPEQPVEQTPAKGTPTDVTPPIEELIPIDEGTRPGESRYGRLAVWLQSRPSKQDRLQLTFKQVEEIVGGDLPASARQHRSWWANDSVSHVQSQNWLDVGWRVAGINMSEEKLIFARIKEREKLYIDFFSSLITELKQKAKNEFKNPSPDGQAWVTMARLLDGTTQAGILTYSFTRDRACALSSTLILVITRRISASLTSSTPVAERSRQQLERRSAGSALTSAAPLASRSTMTARLVIVRPS